METTKANIRISTYGFTCPHCGLTVKKGEVYIQDADGKQLCTNVLPIRRLRKIEKHEN
jgi:hypothetical protein